MPPKIPLAEYTGADVDPKIAQFEKSVQRMLAYKNSAVKLRAAERDVLREVEKLRDFLQIAVRGDKNRLAEVFGGDCARFHRISTAMNCTEFSEMHANDPRFTHLKEIMDAIESVLKTLGRWKAWEALSKPPENIRYDKAVNRFTPSQSVCLAGTVVGCEAYTLQWTVDPALPDVLQLDPKTGEISGVLVPGVEHPRRRYAVTAINNAGAATTYLTFAVGDPPPESIDYNSHVRAEVFTLEHVTWKPDIKGGLPRSWSVDPALPKGLTLDAATGAISGAPTESAARRTYTVKAGNSSGKATADLEFLVKVAPPISIAYDEVQSIIHYDAMTYLKPFVRFQRFAGDEKQQVKWGRIFNSSGAYVGTKWGKARMAFTTGTLTALVGLPPLTFTISPELPKGLVLAQSTGVISGKTAQTTPVTTYTVKVSNEGGSASARFAFAVKMVPPKGLVYPLAAKVIHTGSPVAFNPEVEGIITSWEVSPALPAGLHLDAGMGTISGVPRERMPEATYVITASNEQGSTSTMWKVAVRTPAPVQLVYKHLILEYPVGRYMEIRPTVENEVDRFGLEGDLPSGLALDPKSGIISGTPAKEAPLSHYKVAAENDGGACSVEIVFTTKVMPPTDLLYPRIDDMFYTGEGIDLEPLVIGGADHWSIEPALPAGLALDAETGRIIGTAKGQAEETSYVVTASNQAGGTSAVLTFRITDPPPHGLSYPEAPGGMEFTYFVQSEVRLEPQLDFGVVTTYVVEPALPQGLAIDPASGVISGTPEVGCKMTEFKVTASNAAGSTETTLLFSCAEPAPESSLEIDQQFAANIEECRNIEDLPQCKYEPPSLNWMVWMVHRAHLNDPTLTVVDFSLMTMPLPHEEPRIAPKLMKALAANTHLTSVLLANSNLKAPQAYQLAESLKTNTRLELLNLESNALDSDGVKAVAVSLGQNPESTLTTLRVTSQQHLGLHFGRPVEQAFADMMLKNTRIVKLGFQCQDAHWRDVISRALLKNTDIARRLRKGKRGGDDDEGSALEAKAEQRTCVKMVLKIPPAKAVWEVIDEDDEKAQLLRRWFTEKSQLPSREHLQAFAKAQGQSLAFKEVAPLIKDFRARLINSIVHLSVTMVDSSQRHQDGILKGWSEKNDIGTFDVWPSNEKRFNYTSDQKTTMELSDDFKAWIAIDEDRDAS